MTIFKPATRLFFVTDTLEDNEEIFDTMETALTYFDTLPKMDRPRLYVAMVRNAYIDASTDTWTYEDQGDTFVEILKTIRSKS